MVICLQAYYVCYHGNNIHDQFWQNNIQLFQNLNLTYYIVLGCIYIIIMMLFTIDK